MSDLLKQVALLDALTDKQSEVLVFVSEGLTSKEIARKLGISVSAVNQRIEVIRQRLGGLPRAQIARLYRRQSTLLLTIPTSNSLTGNPIQLQQRGVVAQALSVEGAVNLAWPSAQQESGVLQPSTNSVALDRSNRLWFRLGAIVAVAAGIAATALLVVSVTATLDALYAP
jgi:DNA-binding CsgD family transcriptional regulator